VQPQDDLQRLDPGHAPVQVVTHRDLLAGRLGVRVDDAEGREARLREEPAGRTMRQSVARNEYTSFCRRTWLPVVGTSTPAAFTARRTASAAELTVAVFFKERLC
jgi:hypothetical protein